MTEEYTNRATSGPDVFVSYASQDVSVANSVVEALERQGITCWIAPRDVTPGSQYADEIVGAINDAKVIVLVLSEHAIASPHVGREVERAASKQRRIIAFRTDAAALTRALEYFLSECQWIDVPALGMPAALAKLGQAVGQAVAAPSAVIPESGVGLGTSGQPMAVHSTGIRKRLALAAAAVAVLSIAVSLAVHLWPSKGTALVMAAISDKSIAVLPFTDMSQKKDQEYFADGMAEEIIDLLVKVPDLKVIGRTSSFQFKGKNEDLRTIGARLGVAYVLEGSVRKSGNKVRITAQLIEAQSGTHQWSNTYERDEGDVLKLQDEIAGGIARSLQIAVGADDLKARRTLSHPEAYEVYLRGKHALDRLDKEGFDEATSYFRQALDLDPSFADAAVALSVAYEMQASWAFVAPAVGFEHARRAAESALKLDPALPLANAVLGVINVHYDWDWKAADRALQVALKASPHNPFVLSAAGDLQLALGHYENASQMFKESVARDPLNADNYALLSWAQIRMGQVAEAVEAERKALEIQPGYVWASTYLAAWLLVSGDREAALAAAQREDPAVRAGGLAITLWALGRKAESDTAFEKALTDQADNNAYGIAWGYAYRGDRDQAFKWLDRAYAQKDPCLYAIKGEPLLANLQIDPRYKVFLKKMNLPE